jgi:hypothetical protein
MRTATTLTAATAMVLFGSPAVLICAAISALAFVGLCFGVRSEWRKESRTWTDRDQDDYRLACLEYRTDQRDAREADDFDDLRDNLWGER